METAFEVKVTASVTYIGFKRVSSKTPGELAYEAAGDWLLEHDHEDPQAKLPRWETLDARAQEYWEQIGSTVRAPLVAAINEFVSGEQSARDALHAMIDVAGLRPRAVIRGLWEGTFR